MSITEECFAEDIQDRNPDYVPEPEARCTCRLRRMICGRCQADRDWRRWALEATEKRRGQWLAA
jgi:hypothetical protein